MHPQICSSLTVMFMYLKPDFVEPDYLKDAIKIKTAPHRTTKRTHFLFARVHWKTLLALALKRVNGLIYEYITPKYP